MLSPTRKNHSNPRNGARSHDKNPCRSIACGVIRHPCFRGGHRPSWRRHPACRAATLEKLPPKRPIKLRFVMRRFPPQSEPVVQAGQLSRHGGDGFKYAQTDTQAPVLCPQVAVAAEQRGCGIAESHGRAINHFACPPVQDFDPALFIGRTQSQPTGEVLSLAKFSKSSPASAMTVWAFSTSMPLICVQSIPVVRYSSVCRSNCGAFRLPFLPLGFLTDRLRLQVHLGAQRFQMPAQL